jgi:hypothetical protein
MRFFPLFLLIVACSSGSPTQREARADEVCRNVTNENWRISFWDRADVNVTSQDFCRRKFDLYSVQDRPCTFAGLPAFCNTSPASGITEIRLTNSGGSPIQIWPEDKERIKPHLVIH